MSPTAYAALWRAVPDRLEPGVTQDLVEQWSSAALHEAGHCTAARALGYRTSLMTLTAHQVVERRATRTVVHGYTQVEDVEHHPDHALIVALAGCVAVAAADQGAFSLPHVLGDLQLNPGDTAAVASYGADAAIDLHEAACLAHDLIAGDWEALHHVAALLAEHGELT